MRKFMMFTAAAALAALTPAPSSASPMMASGAFRTAGEATSAVEKVYYRGRYRGYHRPYRSVGYYRPYRSVGYYRPYRYGAYRPYRSYGLYRPYRNYGYYRPYRSYSYAPYYYAAPVAASYYAGYAPSYGYGYGGG